MKKNEQTIKDCIFLFFIVLNSVFCEAQKLEDSLDLQAGSFIDTRDSCKYGYVVINNQCWMSENLNYVCKGSFDLPEDMGCNYKQGRLYNINAAQTACPKGWHLPSNADWNKLAISISKIYGPFKRLDGDWDIVGNFLKRSECWNDKGENIIGFNAVPTGYIQFAKTGLFEYVMTNSSAYWWSDSKVNSDSNWIISLLKGDDKLFLQLGHFTNAYSVRCVK